MIAFWRLSANSAVLFAVFAVAFASFAISKKGLTKLPNCDTFPPKLDEEPPHSIAMSSEPDIV